MPKKSFKKKKLFQAHCREQVKKGFINHPDGSWKGFQTQSRMDNMMKDGYKL